MKTMEMYVDEKRKIGYTSFNLYNDSLEKLGHLEGVAETRPLEPVEKDMYPIITKHLKHALAFGQEEAGFFLTHLYSGNNEIIERNIYKAKFYSELGKLLGSDSCTKLLAGIDPGIPELQSFMQNHRNIPVEISEKAQKYANVIRNNIEHLDYHENKAISCEDLAEISIIFKQIDSDNTLDIIGHDSAHGSNDSSCCIIL